MKKEENTPNADSNGLKRTQTDSNGLKLHKIKNP